MTRVFSIVTYRLLLAIVVGSLVVFGMVLALAVGSAPDAQPGLVPVVGIWIPLLIAVIVIPILTLLVQPWVYLHDMNVMLAGLAWVHWTYDEATWASANVMEGTRLRRTAYVGALFLLAGSAVIIVASVALGGQAGTSLRLGGGLAAGGALVAVAAIGGTSTSLFARRHKRGEIYISPTGIFRRPGGYTPLRGFGYWLDNVELREAERTSIHFDVRISTRPTRQSLADVLVPPGREAEARDLVARLHHEVLHGLQPEPHPSPDKTPATDATPHPRAGDPPM
jgi:hypothetical protein